LDPHERSKALLGEAALHILAKSHVLVVGLGGVGSFALEALARGGIGRLTLVDADIISASNLNRQLFALWPTLGRYKTDLARERTLAINPTCQVTCYPQRVTSENAADFLAAKPDWLVDAIDDLPAKGALLAAAQSLGVASISVLGTGNRTNPQAGFTVADISETHTCPLARSLRRQLRLRGIDSGLLVVYSPLPPEALHCVATTPGVPRTIGSVSYIPGQAGLIAAGEVLRRLSR